LAFLLGTWRGGGSGSYPGSKSFEYEEELTFSHVGKPVLVYTMRTSQSPAGPPSHAEHGFIRCHEGSRLDCVAAHATGHVEVSCGTVDGNSVKLASTSVLAWPGSKEVVALGRWVQVAGDVLTDRLDMQATGHMLQTHVVADLKRV
jgi:hypothetical protein